MRAPPPSPPKPPGPALTCGAMVALQVEAVVVSSRVYPERVILGKHRLIPSPQVHTHGVVAGFSQAVQGLIAWGVGSVFSSGPGAQRAPMPSLAPHSLRH